MNKIGENIRIAREKAGLTQDELAQKLGYKTRSSIAKIENGTNDIPQSKIVLIAKALNTTPSMIMGWDREPDKLDLTVLEKYPDFVPGRNYLIQFEGKSLAVRDYNVIKRFQSLDEHGKELVEIILDKEYKRCKQTQHKAAIPTVIAAQGGGINTEISPENENAVLDKLEELDKNERKNNLGL